MKVEIVPFLVMMVSRPSPPTRLTVCPIVVPSVDSPHESEIDGRDKGESLSVNIDELGSWIHHHHPSGGVGAEHRRVIDDSRGSCGAGYHNSINYDCCLRRGHNSGGPNNKKDGDEHELLHERPLPEAGRIANPPILYLTFSILQVKRIFP